MTPQPRNPTRKVGMVVLNGRIHTNLKTQISMAQRPYYPHLVGSAADKAEKNGASNGDVAFTVISTQASINALMHIQGDAGADGLGLTNNSVCAITHLNGMGDGERDATRIMHKIVPLGIVEQGDAGALFNVVRQGNLTVINTSDQTWHRGTKLRAYNPTLEELGENVCGPIKLVLRPFDASTHSATPKPVYQCLRDFAAGGRVAQQAARSYLPSYKRACFAFVDSALGLTSCVVGALGWEAVREAATKATSEAHLVRLMHGAMLTPGFNARLLNTLFPQYADEPNWLDKVAAAGLSEVNKRQAEAAGGFMLAVAQAHADEEKNVVATCHVTALPGEPALIQVNL